MVSLSQPLPPIWLESADCYKTWGVVFAGLRYDEQKREEETNECNSALYITGEKGNMGQTTQTHYSKTYKDDEKFTPWNSR